MADRARVGIVQLRVRTGQVDDNLERAGRWVAEAAARGCDLVVLPEAFATSLDLPKSRELAAGLGGRLRGWLAERAAEHRVHLVGGVLEEHDGTTSSSAILIDGDGQVRHHYRRASIYDLERYFLAPGEGGAVADTPLGRVGIAMGYDVQFPEVLRVLFAQGVELLVCPSLLLRPFAASVRQMVLARAAENCCYVLFASATGENTLAGLTYMGGSLIAQGPVGVRPYSNNFRGQEPVLAEAGIDEALLVADLGLADLRRLQEANPLARDFARSPLRDALLRAAGAGREEDRRTVVR